MTKVYLSNDQYEVYLTSGNMVILSEADIEELVDNSEQLEELKEELEVATSKINTISNSISEEQRELREFEETIIPKISRTKTRIEAQDAIEDIANIMNGYL